jgi:putative membrane protein
MSHLLSRTILTTALACSALCFACSSDQKTTNSPDNTVPPAEPPANTPSSMPAPNGEPNNTPPSTPPPQSINDTTPSNAAATADAPSTMAKPTRLSESQIAMITQLANTAEIEQAKLAQSKAKSPSVKKFAAMMVRDHTEAKNEQAKLYKRLNLTAVQSPDAIALKDDADRATGSLRGADGQAFDVAYMDAQVDAHQKVLDAIDKNLLPAATQQELIDDLKKMRSTVDAHLKEAKSLQAQLTTNRQSVSSSMH